MLIVNAAVCGSTSIFARTTTGGLPAASNGPAFAGFTIDRPNGAPRHACSVRYTLPPVTVNGSLPTRRYDRFPDQASRATRARVRVRFITELDACEDPREPRRECSTTALIDCWPSSRLSVVDSGVKPPALMLVDPEDSAGANGSAAPGQGEPPGCASVFGPLVISNVEEPQHLVDPFPVRPRFERRGRGVRITVSGCRERRAFTAEEPHFGVFER